MSGARREKTGGDQSSAREAWFATTQWHIVLAAGHHSDPHSRAALETLCRTYWYPLYFYLRRSGYDVEDAEDLIQGFFAHMLDGSMLRGLTPHGGRFRSFLLTSLKHHLAHEREKACAQKRGGGRSLLPLDVASAETLYARASSQPLSADQFYAQRWAETLLERALDRLRDLYVRAGKEDLFEGIEGLLTSADSVEGTYQERGRRLGMSEGAVKVAVHRLRARFGDCLREEVAQTVSDPEEIDDEMRELLSWQR